MEEDPDRQAEPSPAAVKERKLKEDADKQFFQASFHWHHGELEQAHKLCSKAIAVFPKHKRAYLLRCEVALKLKRWEEAAGDASAAIALGHREGHRARGAVHLERGRWRDAVADLNVAVRLEPTDRRAWALRSRAHRGLGNAERAEEDAAEAERRDPDSEAGLCVVCLDEPRATRLNPCEHSVLCAPCAQECQDHHGACPICNTTIKAIEYGTFLGTFAPSDTANLDTLASAMKKAREELALLGGRETAAGTLNPIGEGSPLAATPDAADRPATPPLERDYSEYTVGGDMDDVNGERSVPSTPAVMARGFGDVGGLYGVDAGEQTPSMNGGTPGWSNRATHGMASPGSVSSDYGSSDGEDGSVTGLPRVERASAPVMPSMPEEEPWRAGEQSVVDGASGGGGEPSPSPSPSTPPEAGDQRPARASSPPALSGGGRGDDADVVAHAEGEVDGEVNTSGGDSDDAAVALATEDEAEAMAENREAEVPDGALQESTTAAEAARGEPGEEQ